MAEYLPDRIFADENVVRELADTGVTPFYLYDERGIGNSVKELHSSFSFLEGHRNYVLLREQFNPQILQILQRNESGIHVCSLIELRLAISCGFSGEAVLYEPSVKDPEAEKLAREIGAVWMLDSEKLMPEVLPERFLLRVYPSDIPYECSKSSSFGREKCGFSEDDLMDLVKSLRNKGITRIGLAVQMSDYSVKTKFWVKKAEYLLQLSRRLEKQFGTRVTTIHIGEGPGLPYHAELPVPDLKEEVDGIGSLLAGLPDEDRPCVLTGLTIRLLAPHGLLVTKVLEERRLLHNFLIVDAGFCQFPRAIIRRSYRHVSVLGDRETIGRKVYSIVGSVPSPLDRAVFRIRTIPRVVPGDYCVIHDVGCCGRSLSALFAFQPVAGEYLYCSDGSVRMIAKPRSSEEVLEFLTAL